MGCNITTDWAWCDRMTTQLRRFTGSSSLQPSNHRGGQPYMGLLIKQLTYSSDFFRAISPTASTYQSIVIVCSGPVPSVTLKKLYRIMWMCFICHYLFYFQIGTLPETYKLKIVCITLQWNWLFWRVKLLRNGSQMKTFVVFPDRVGFVCYWVGD